MGESLRTRSPSIPIPGVRRRAREDVEEEESLHYGTKSDHGALADEEGDDGGDPQGQDQSQYQFSISCQEDGEERPAFYVPSSSYRRPSTLVGSLTSWHQSSSALLQSSSPSAWPSSPAVGPTFSFNADDDVPYISIDAVEADSDDADDVNNDVESTNAAAEQPRGMRVLPRRNAVSEVRLADFHPHLRDNRRSSLPAQFDAQHPSARSIGVELCRIADEIEALFIAERDMDGANDSNRWRWRPRKYASMKFAMDYLMQSRPRRESFYDVHGTVKQRRHFMTDFIFCRI